MNTELLVAVREYLAAEDACLMAASREEQWKVAHRRREEARHRLEKLLAESEPVL